MKRRRATVAVIDYGMGNLRSIQKGWEVVGARVEVVHLPEETERADILVFPGQGAIVDCMRLLVERGFDKTIRDWIEADKPYFGVCLGLEALFDRSEEGNARCLGIFPGRVRRFDLSREYKIPHMGWNSVAFLKNRPPNAGLEKKTDQFYFVHSYHVVPEDGDLAWCVTHYGYPFVSGIASGNCFATQFHPEKSQAKGLQIYRNFLEWVEEGL